MSQAIGSGADVRWLGVSPQGWGFAGRTWLAIVLSLFIAFWLQLESASSAAVTVAILAQPTRGQAFTKAVYRLFATFLGLVASVAIAGLFGGMPLLYFGACLAWVAVSVYLASFIDGSRAYGVVLSGYTVAIAAGPLIDNPAGVFMYSVDRAAAVSIGVVTVAVVSNSFGAPDIYDRLLPRIRTAAADTRAFVERTLRQDGAGMAETLAILKLIAGLRPDTEALWTESAIGRARQSAARNTIAGLVGAVFAARGVVQAEAGTRDGPAPAMPDRGGLDERWVRRRRVQLARQLRVTRLNLHLLEHGRAPAASAVLPIHRDRPVALLSALRTVLCVTAAAAVLRFGGWPSTSLSVSLVGVLIALGATNPDPFLFNRTAAYMMPVIFAVGGVIEFVVLGGSDSFPALALALLPSTVVACLLTLDPRTFSPGFLLLVFPLSVFAPTNPQSYDPASYLTSGTLLCLAVFLVFPLFRAVLPLDTADRRRWILQATRQDLEAAMAGRARHSAADTAYLNADRVLQLAALPQQAQDEGAEHAMAEGLAMGEMTLALMNLRAIRMAADRALPGGAVPARGAARVRAARAALHRGDADALRRLAEEVEAGPAPETGEEPAGHVRHRLNWAAELAGLAHLVSARHPGPKA